MADAVLNSDAVRRRRKACTPTTTDFMQLGKLFSTGANSEVYEGTMVTTNTRVVCKAMHCGTEDQENRFFREARATVRAQSQFVPRLVSLSTGGGRSNIVMEKYDCDLSQCLDVYSNEYSAKIAVYQVLLILQKLHARGIVHLDISMKNVLVVKKEDKDDSPLLLTDFGASVFLREDGSVEVENSTTVSSALPPECQTPSGGGKPKMAKNPKCDAFAAVRLLFQLVTKGTWALFVSKTSAVEGEIPKLDRTMPIDCPSELRHALAAAQFDPSFSQAGKEFFVRAFDTNDPEKRPSVDDLIGDSYFFDVVDRVKAIFYNHNMTWLTADYNLRESREFPPIMMPVRAGFTDKDIHDLEYRFMIVLDEAMPPYSKSYKAADGGIDHQELLRVNQKAHWMNLIDKVTDTQDTVHVLNDRLEVMIDAWAGVTGDIRIQAADLIRSANNTDRTAPSPDFVRDAVAFAEQVMRLAITPNGTLVDNVVSQTAAGGDQTDARVEGVANSSNVADRSAVHTDAIVDGAAGGLDHNVTENAVVNTPAGDAARDGSAVPDDAIPMEHDGYDQDEQQANMHNPTDRPATNADTLARGEGGEHGRGGRTPHSRLGNVNQVDWINFSHMVNRASLMMDRADHMMFNNTIHQCHAAAGVAVSADRRPMSIIREAEILYGGGDQPSMDHEQQANPHNHDVPIDEDEETIDKHKNNKKIIGLDVVFRRAYDGLLHKSFKMVHLKNIWTNSLGNGSYSGKKIELVCDILTVLLHEAMNANGVLRLKLMKSSDKL